MEKSTQAALAALMAHAGLKPREGDFERFGEIIDLYVASLKTLHSVDLEDEEIGPVFRPGWSED
jgi:hypothetical protein